MSETVNEEMSLTEKTQVAMQRVSQAVIKRARDTSTPVVVWIDGKTAYLTPDEAEKMVAEQAQQREESQPFTTPQ